MVCGRGQRTGTRAAWRGAASGVAFSDSPCRHFACRRWFRLVAGYHAANTPTVSGARATPAPDRAIALASRAQGTARWQASTSPWRAPQAADPVALVPAQESGSRATTGGMMGCRVSARRCMWLARRCIGSLQTVRMPRRRPTWRVAPRPTRSRDHRNLIGAHHRHQEACHEGARGHQSVHQGTDDVQGEAGSEDCQSSAGKGGQRRGSVTFVEGHALVTVKKPRRRGRGFPET
jgi:hypothetical protein